MVKCAECGFLALRSEETQALLEAFDIYRKQGTVGYMEAPSIGRIPVCFVMKASFRDELFEIIPEGTPNSEKATRMFAPLNADVLVLIHRDRGNCDGFVEWRQGFTPKEHREMMDREAMLEREERREREDKEWRAEQENKTREWQESQTRQNQQFLVKLAILAGLFALLAGVMSAWLGGQLAG